LLNAIDSIADLLLSVVPGTYSGNYFHTVSTSNLDMQIQSYSRSEAPTNVSYPEPNQSDTYIHVSEGFLWTTEEERIEAVGTLIKGDVGQNMFPGSANK
jgi:hypothetical protein